MCAAQSDCFHSTARTPGKRLMQIFFFFLAIPRYMELPSQGSDLSHIRNLNHSFGSARS